MKVYLYNDSLDTEMVVTRHVGAREQPVATVDPQDGLHETVGDLEILMVKPGAKVKPVPPAVIKTITQPWPFPTGGSTDETDDEAATNS